MLFSPTNLFPSILSGSDTIDATEINEFSFQINGNTKVIKYRCIIYKNDTQSTLIYDTGIQELAEPLYPKNYLGENQRITIVIPSDSGMINGNEYKYTVEVFDANMSTKTSEEPFKAIKTPTINLEVPSTITIKSHEFNGEYVQENGVQIKYFIWTLKNLTNNRIVKQTDKIYSQDLRFFYDGFLTDNSYSIKLEIVNQDNFKLETEEIVFNVEYEAFPITGFALTEVVNSQSAIKVKWSPTICTGKPIGDGFEFLSDVPYVGLTSLKIPYDSKVMFDQINGAKINIQSNVVHVIRTTPYPTTDRNVIYKAIGNYNNSEFFIEVFTKFYSIYININNESEHWLCHQTNNEDILTLVITSDNVTTNIIRKTGGLYPHNGLYPSTGLYPMSSHTKVVEISNTPIYINPNARFNSFELYGAQDIDYLWITTRITDEVLNRLFDIDFEPSWNAETKLLALFNSDYDAGDTFINIVGFSKWDVYREELDYGTLDFVGSVGTENFGVVDYLISGNGHYKYYVYPVGEYGVGFPLMSDEVYVNQKDWVLITSKEIFSDSKELSVNRVFTFFADVQSSDISNNNTPNILQGFTRYPKIQRTNSNYLSGQLSTLVGIFEEDCEDAQVSGGFNQTKDIFNALYELSTDGRRKFLKDPLGNVYEVQVSSPITQKIKDELSKDFASFTLPWVQIGSIDGISLIGVLNDG